MATNDELIREIERFVEQAAVVREEQQTAQLEDLRRIDAHEKLILRLMRRVDAKDMADRIRDVHIRILYAILACIAIVFIIGILLSLRG